MCVCVLGLKHTQTDREKVGVSWKKTKGSWLMESGRGVREGNEDVDMAKIHYKHE